MTYKDDFMRFYVVEFLRNFHKKYSSLAQEIKISKLFECILTNWPKVWLTVDSEWTDNCVKGTVFNSESISRRQRKSATVNFNVCRTQQFLLLLQYIVVPSKRLSFYLSARWVGKIFYQNLFRRLHFYHLSKMKQKFTLN